MKSFTVIAAVVLLTCIYVEGNTAIPFSGMQTEEVRETKTEPETQELAVKSQEVTDHLAFFRTKRQTHLSLCRYCCNCCRNKGCGYCCRF